LSNTAGDVVHGLIMPRRVAPAGVSASALAGTPSESQKQEAFMGETGSNAASGVLEGVKGWVKRTFGRATDRPDIEREGRAQEAKGEAERDAALHEAKAARAKAEAEAREVQQQAAEWDKESRR
jgi:uncharacterized protein YjbJ (UPF0337 family)